MKSACAIKTLLAVSMATAWFASVSVAENSRTFVGPVQSLRIENATFIHQADAWMEGPRRLVSLISFDVKGTVIESTHYGEGGSVGFQYKVIPAYDSDGRLIELTTVRTDGFNSTGKTSYAYDNNGHLVLEQDSEGSKQTYNYDAGGRLVEQTIFYKDGTPLRREVFEYDSASKIEHRFYYMSDNGSMRLEGVTKFSYDERGRLSKASIYNADGSPVFTDIYAYNNRGLRTNETTYTPDGSVLMEKVKLYDERGNTVVESYAPPLSEEVLRTRCLPHGCRPDEIRYEYDDKNNWIKRIEFGKAGTEPLGVIYRTFTYYH